MSNKQDRYLYYMNGWYDAVSPRNYKPLSAPTDPDDLVSVYMKGYNDGRKAIRAAKNKARGRSNLRKLR